MNMESSEPNSENEKHLLKERFRAIADRLSGVLDHTEKVLKNPKSHLSNMGRNLMHPVTLNMELWEKEGESAVDFDLVRLRLQALEDYLNLLERRPEFEKWEQLESGGFPEIDAEAIRKLKKAEHDGTRFDRHVYYVAEVKKRLGE